VLGALQTGIRGGVWSLCAAALLCAAAGTAAQTVHKQLDAAGRITYTDRPDVTPSPRAETVRAMDVANALASNTAMSSRGAARVDANEATRRLRQAQLKREQGADPLPGEQVPGIAVRVVNDRYWQRQEALRRAVEQAQRRADKTGRVAPRRPLRIPR
jgi:hypothetical protein